MRILPFAFLALAATAAGGQEPMVLSHDDGKQDDKRSQAGTGHAVRFERPAAGFAVTGARLFGSRYGGRYDPALEIAMVWVCDEGLAPLAAAPVPLEAFPVGDPQWVEVSLPPVLPPATFFVLVDFFATGTRGVYLGIDAKAEGRSLSGTLGKPGAALAGGGWMIRAVGTRRPEPLPALDPATRRELAHDDGQPDGKRSLAGDGHAILFAAPAGDWFLDAVALHGSLYGGGYDPDRTYFQIFVCDPRLKILSRSAFPISLFAPGEEKWVELPIPPLRVKGKFAVVVAFNPTQTRGVYLSLDKARNSHSLTALPGRPGKALKGEEWMVRAILMKHGQGPAKAAPPERKIDSGPDALELAEARRRFEALAAAEDAEGIGKLVADLARRSPEAAADLGKVHATSHTFVWYTNIPDEYARAVAAIYEACDDSLRRRFGFARGICAVPGKRLHVHLEARQGLELNLWVSPGSAAFPLIVNTMPSWQRGLSPPAKGGPHIVYGLCHELGHVVMGWQDDRHQWAHYLGSMLLEDVVAALGDKVWPQAYDCRAEGMARFLAQIENAKPDRATEAGTGRIFHGVGEAFGTAVWGKAAAWIQANRQGEAFHAYRLYLLDDLRDALLALGCDRAKVESLLGVAPTNRK